MFISSFGGPTLKIRHESPAIPDGFVELLINPYSSIAGLPKLRKQQASIVLVSLDNKEYYGKETHDEKALVIQTPGEYEMRGILINAREVGSTNAPLILYRLDIGNVSLGYIGGLSAVINGEAVEHIEGVDALVIPVGGKGVVSAKDAVRMISELEPRIVIPIEYRSTRFPIGRESVEAFLREVGAKGVTPVPKLKVTRKDLPVDDRKVVLLE